MSPRRRAIVLLALAAVLGTLAASDVSRREAALRRGLGPQVAVVVARRDLPADTPLSAQQLDVRDVPARFAPARAFHRGAQLQGLRTTIAVPAGADLQPEMVGVGGAPSPVAGPPLAPGQRIIGIVASASPREIVAGGRVDVLITRDAAGGSGAGATSLALADVPVVAVAPSSNTDGGPHVTAQLRVSVRDAVMLTSAQQYARDIRLLARPGGAGGGS